MTLSTAYYNMAELWQIWKLFSVKAIIVQLHSNVLPNRVLPDIFHVHMVLSSTLTKLYAPAATLVPT